DVQIRGAGAHPFSQRGGVLIDGESGYQATLTRVSRITCADLHVVEVPVNRAAFNRAAHHEVVRTPAVIASFAIRRERAAEIGFGECRDVVLHAELDGRVVERLKAGIKQLQQIGMLAEQYGGIAGPWPQRASGRVQLIAVRVEAAAVDRNE